MSIGLLLSLVSCNKPSIQSPDKPGERKNFLTIEDFTSADLRDAENLENPYDNFGREHFNGIVYVVKDLKGSVSSSISLIYKRALDFEKTLPSSLSLRSTNDLQVTEDDFIDIYQSVKKNFSFKIADSASPELKQEIERFSQVFLQLKEEKENFDYAKIKQSIVAFESDVLKNTSLSERDKSILLKATSTSRYSALQWERPIAKLLTDVEPSSDKVAQLKWHHWLIIAAADAAGATLGVTLGGGVGVGVAASKAAYDIIVSELKKEEDVKEPVTVDTELEQASEK